MLSHPLANFANPQDHSVDELSPHPTEVSCADVWLTSVVLVRDDGIVRALPSSMP